MKFAALWAVCLAICCGGCGGGDNTVAVNDTTTNSIEGTWMANTIQAPSGPVESCPTSITVGNETFACGLSDTQVYRGDGSYSESNGQQRGTWSTSGNTVTITINGKARTFTFAVQANELTEQQSSAQGPVTITYTRQ